MRSVLAALLLAPLIGFVGSDFAAAQSCGCGQPTCGICKSECACRGHCHHRHGRRCCCPESRETREARSIPRSTIPSGPIVESYPVMRAMPAMMAMPMMPVAYGAPVTGRSLEQPRELTCQDSHDRLDDLEQRVNALDLRMKTILRAVEMQTVILEQLRDQQAAGAK